MEIPPPIAASVQHTGGASALSFTDKVSSVFAGGNAAIYAAGDKPGAGGLDAVACVSEDVPGLYHAGHVAPLVFGTDTVIGLHVSFPAGASQLEIVSGNLGYRRFEMAVAPVFSSADGCTKQDMLDAAQGADDAAKAVVANEDNSVSASQKAQDTAAQKMADSKLLEAKNNVKDPKTNNLVAVYVPSTLAIANDAVGATPGSPAPAGNLTIAQVFATGKAAEVIAANNAFGSIGAVAAAAKPMAASGPVFNVSVSGTLAQNAQAILSPALALNGKNFDVTAFIYKADPATDNATTIAKGLAKNISTNLTLQLLGVSAKQTGSQIALTIPTNLAFLTSPLAWDGTHSTGGISVALVKPGE